MGEFHISDPPLQITEVSLQAPKSHPVSIMRHPPSWCCLALSLCWSVAAQDHSQFVLFPGIIGGGTSRDSPIDAAFGFGNTTVISAACASALNSTIQCDQRVRYLASENYYDSLNGTETELCTTVCKNSLATYHQAVASACQGTQVYEGAPNSWRAGEGTLLISSAIKKADTCPWLDKIWAWVNATCQTHSGTGQLCAGKFLSTPLNNPRPFAWSCQT